MQKMKIYDMSHADSVIRESDLAPTLVARMGTGGGQVPIILSLKGANNVTSTQITLSENGTNSSVGINKSPPLKTTTPIYCLAENSIGRKPENGGNGIGVNEDTSFTLNATGVHGVATESAVRKLLPVECERLQGFQDGWTQIPYRGKPAEQCPDAPRYKAIGNSWCVPVVRWIGQRIEKELKNGN